MGGFDSAIVRADGEGRWRGAAACIYYCTNMVADFAATARRIGMRPEAMDPVVAPWPVSCVAEGDHGGRWAQAWILLLNSSSRDTVAQKAAAAAIAVDGTAYLNQRHTSALVLGRVLAGLCAYDTEVAQNLFKAALTGDPFAAPLFGLG